jgi:hypothetical protein
MAAWFIVRPSNTTAVLFLLANETKNGVAESSLLDTQALFRRNTINESLRCVREAPLASTLVERMSQSAGIEREPWYTWVPFVTLWWTSTGVVGVYRWSTTGATAIFVAGIVGELPRASKETPHQPTTSSTSTPINTNKPRFFASFFDTPKVYAHPFYTRMVLSTLQ